MALLLRIPAQSPKPRDNGLRTKLLLPWPSLKASRRKKKALESVVALLLRAPNAAHRKSNLV